MGGARIVSGCVTPRAFGEQRHARPREHRGRLRFRTAGLGVDPQVDLSFFGCLLVHGARSVLQRAAQREDRLSRWATRLKATRGTHKATVALANKMARIGWAVVREHTVFGAA